jgi:hypothetical protein
MRLSDTPKNISLIRLEECAEAAYMADSLEFEEGDWARADVYERNAYRSMAEAVLRAAGIEVYNP